MILKAEFVLATFDIFGSEWMATGADRVELLDCVDQGMGNLGFRIRSVVFRAFSVLFSGNKNAWKQFFCHTNPRVGLIILEQHVIAWLELLDKTILKVEGFFLAIDNNIFHIPDVAH